MQGKVTVQDRYEVSLSLKSINKVTIVLGLFTGAKIQLLTFGQISAVGEGGKEDTDLKMT